MGSAKALIVRPIERDTANEFMRRVHYSGRIVQNTQVHLGVFLRGSLEGAIQFGPSMVKHNIVHLVEGTGWNEFLELNRLAFTDVLPRNSESRALGVALRLLRRYAPHVKWVVSFADAVQCGDGTIYRAAGFVLTGITRNKDLIRLPGGRVVHKVTLSCKGSHLARGLAGLMGGSSAGGAEWARRTGGELLEGAMLRYMFFLDPSYRERLTVPEIPFSAIAEKGYAMFRGERQGGGPLEGPTPPG